MKDAEAPRAADLRQAFKKYVLLRALCLVVALVFAGAVALAFLGGSMVTLIVGLSCAVIAYASFWLVMRKRRAAFRALDRFR